MIGRLWSVSASSKRLPFSSCLQVVTALGAACESFLIPDVVLVVNSATLAFAPQS